MRDSLPQVAVALVIAAFVLMHTWEDLQRSFGSEYYQNWVVAQEIHANNAQQLYSPQWSRDIGQKYWLIGHSPSATQHQLVASDAHRTLDSYSTPLVYSMIDLLSTSNYAQSLQIYRIIQFSSGIIAIVLLCRLLEYSWTATILAVTVLWGWGEPFLADILAADIQQIQLVLIALLLLIELRIKRRIGDFLAGIVLASIVLLHPQFILIPLLLFPILRKDRLRRHVAGFLITVIGLIVFSSLKFGSSRCWTDWLGALHEIWTLHPAVLLGNCSLAEILREQIGSLASDVLSIALAAGAFALIRFARKKFALPIYLIIALAAALPLLIWPIARQTDFVLAVPVLLFTFRPTDERVNTVILRWLVGSIALLLFCNSQLTTNILWLDDPQGIAARLAGSTLVFICLVKPGPSGPGGSLSRSTRESQSPHPQP